MVSQAEVKIHLCVSVARSRDGEPQTLTETELALRTAAYTAVSKGFATGPQESPATVRYSRGSPVLAAEDRAGGVWSPPELGVCVLKGDAL